MHRFKYLVFLVPFLFIVQPSFADDRTKVVGLWKVISFETEFQATSERETVLGKNPMGYVMFTPEGRIWSIVTGEKREAPKTDQDRAALFKTMFAYTGMFRVEGDKLITKVDVSWNPAWLGTEQVRFFKIDGDRIQHFSPWIPAVTKPERAMARGITTLERVKTDDPLTGVWELNLEKSKFTNIPAPKSEIRTYEVTGQREIMTSERIDAKGQLVISEFLATRDGQDVPQTGRSLYDSISVSPIDALTAYYTHKKAGKMVGDGTRVISKDAKTMTITFKGTGPKGQPVGATFVYDKR